MSLLSDYRIANPQAGLIESIVAVIRAGQGIGGAGQTLATYMEAHPRSGLIEAMVQCIGTGAGGNANVRDDAVVRPPAAYVRVIERFTNLSGNPVPANSGVTYLDPAFFQLFLNNANNIGSQPTLDMRTGNPFTASNVSELITIWSAFPNMFGAGLYFSASPVEVLSDDIVTNILVSGSSLVLIYPWHGMPISFNTDTIDASGNAFTTAEVVRILAQARAAKDSGYSLVNLFLNGGTSAPIPRRNEGGWTFTNGEAVNPIIWTSTDTVYSIEEFPGVNFVDSDVTSTKYRLGVGDLPTAAQKTAKILELILATGQFFDDGTDLVPIHVGNVWTVTGKNADQKWLEGNGVFVTTN